MAQRSEGRCLDRRPLSDRIAVGDSDLDDVRTRLDQLGNQLLGGLDVGVTPCQKDDQCGPSLPARAFERGIDAVHLRPPSRRRASATSLSPRPDRLMTTIVSAGRRGARLRSSAIACADSKAGMMPSVRER